MRLFNRLAAAILFAGIFPADAVTVRLFDDAYFAASISLSIARASYLLARRATYRMATPSDEMAQACSIQSGALDGTLEVQLNNKERTGLSCSSAQSATAYS